HDLLARHRALRLPQIDPLDREASHHLRKEPPASGEAPRRLTVLVGEEGLEGMRSLSVERIDLRETERAVSGQEVMTADKVTLRLTAMARYRIVDAEKATETVRELDSALYGEIQMAVRREVAGHRLDQLLDARREVSAALLAQVQERAAPWGVEVRSVDVKDIVLPGDMKALMNQVIEAEKQAAAQVILRREETAAVRSQANTAKMLDASPTLRRLKELEAMKEIAQAIDQVTLVAGADELVSRIVTKQVGNT
ncbi:MAG: slipin family protein, partial [Myxococcota bacterium]